MTKRTTHVPAVAAVLDDPFLNRGVAYTTGERERRPACEGSAV